MLNKIIGYAAIILALLFLAGAVAGLYSRAHAISVSLNEVPQ